MSLPQDNGPINSDGSKPEYVKKLLERGNPAGTKVEHHTITVIGPDALQAALDHWGDYGWGCCAMAVSPRGAALLVTFSRVKVEVGSGVIQPDGEG